MTITMTLNELYEEMRAALAGPVDAATVDRLCTGAQHFASTVGWAGGVIDKDGNIAGAFNALRTKAQMRLESAPDSHTASLYEALSNLILAVQNHDEDLDPSPDNHELEHDD